MNYDSIPVLKPGESLLTPFIRSKFICDIEDKVHTRIMQTAETFYRDQNHVLNRCFIQGGIL